MKKEFIRLLYEHELIRCFRYSYYDKNYTFWISANFLPVVHKPSLFSATASKMTVTKVVQEFQDFQKLHLQLMDLMSLQVIISIHVTTTYWLDVNPHHSFSLWSFASKILKYISIIFSLTFMSFSFSFFIYLILCFPPSFVDLSCSVFLFESINFWHYRWHWRF